VATAVISPSASAVMICTSEAAQEIAEAIGTQPSAPPTPSWADSTYSCRYVYPQGAMILSVRELPDAAATTAYFTGLRKTLPGVTDLEVLGQPALAASDGTIVVRKDFKVLQVDVRGFPTPSAS
jgi:hypothetical protein